MQLQDIVTKIEDLTDDELLERIRKTRANRTTIRPAAKAHAKRAETKQTTAKHSKLNKLLNGLTPDQIAAIVADLEKK